MDNMLEIPKEMKRVNALKLCLMLGLTAILYLMIANEFSQISQTMTAPQAAA